MVARSSAAGRGYVRIRGETIPALASAVRRGELRPVRAGRGMDRLPRALTLTLTLRRSNEAGFQRYLAAVQDPRSREYRRFLSQRQLTARFGPTAGAFGAARAWLQGRGFSVIKGSSNRLTLTFRGTRGQAERAFKVRLEGYRGRGRLVYSIDRDPAVPSRIARYVLAVTGLSDLAQPTRRAPAVGKTATAGAICVGAIALTGLPGAFGCALGFVALAIGAVFCGFEARYDPGGPGYNICRSFFGVRHRLTNATNKQKIGLLEFDTFHPSDAADFVTLLGADPAVNARLSEVPVNGGVATPGAGETEVLLDADAVMTVDPSPLASYVVYDAPPSTTFQQLFNAMIADGDTVISNSWSQCEDQTPLADATSIDSILQQAAASGVSVFNGSGDTGSTCLDGAANTIGVPSDSPSATATGGTSPELGAGGAWGGATWWDGAGHTPATGAGGYGVSRYFPRPAYQAGLTAAPGRSIPDVAVGADPAEGLELCQADAGGCPTGSLVGGTSFAAPVMAAMTADLNQALGTNVGNANTALYPLANTRAFHDAASLGSDFAHVGLGTPSLDYVRLALAHQSIGPVNTSSSLLNTTPANVPADGVASVVIRADLTDANAYPIAGKTVSVSTSAGSHAVVSQPTATSDADGFVTFTATDTTAETVTFTVTDTTDGVTLPTTTATLVAPVATGAEISASPSTVLNDGTSAATVTVYLENRLGRPAAGKTVSLSAAGSSAVMSPPSGQAVTDSTGNAVFHVTDSSQQSVSLTAADVTDGNLPVPGSATVTFEANGSSSCSDTPPTPAGGYSVAQWASGEDYNPQPITTTVGGGGTVTVLACSGPSVPAFDSSGNSLTADVIGGSIYAFGPQGGAVDSTTPLPGTSFKPVVEIGSLAFATSGELYAGLDSTNGDYSLPRVARLDPATGAMERVIATAANGVKPCPVVAVQPASGDLFAGDECFGGSIESHAIMRIANPTSATPTVTTYADAGSPVLGLAFAPDGTLYVSTRGGSIVAVAPPVGMSPPTVTTVATFAHPAFGVAVAHVDGQGHATALYATDTGGNIYRIDVTVNPATTTTIASGGASLGEASIGPDGCLYVGDLDTTLKIGGTCTASTQPALTLTQTGGSATPQTGSQVELTASLANATVPAGTPVRLVVAGANAQPALAHTDAGGHAAFRYTGALTGTDRATAQVIVNGTRVVSAPRAVRWIAGKDVTYVSLNGSQESGAPGQPARFNVQLTDISQVPAAAVTGAQVTVTVQGHTCAVTTDSSGAGSCSLTPPGPFGLTTVSASYAGDSSHTASTGSDFFEVGGLGLPAAPGGAHTPPGPGPNAAPPSAQPANLCGKVTVDLLDVYVSGGRVQLLGYADPRMAGHAVKITSLWNKRPAAAAKVGSDGYFRTSAKLPPSKIRGGNGARYRAIMSRYTSPALKLSRRLYVFTVTRAGSGKVVISGQVVKPLTVPPAPIGVSRRDNCRTRYQPLHASLKLNKSTGMFSITAPAPPSSAPGAVYLLRTRVRRSAQGHRAFTTFSLPRVVNR